MKIIEYEGDLIVEALKGKFDVIGHCCNCFCTMGAGIAVPMAKIFGANNFKMEGKEYRGNLDKLGTIDYNKFLLVKNSNEKVVPIKSNYGHDYNRLNHPELIVVNMYAQYGYGNFGKSKEGVPFDITAFTKCLKEMNILFKGKHIGLPGYIGCGLAGGNWVNVKKIIENELVDCNISLVYLSVKK